MVTMDQFTAARLKAEKRLEKRGQSLQEREAVIQGANQAVTMDIKPSKKKDVRVTVGIMVGDEAYSFDFDAPQFMGTVAPNKINEKDLGQMVKEALFAKFGKLA